MTAGPPLRVLQVVDSLGMGGAETWLIEVLRRWSHDGTGRMDFLLTGGERGIFDDEAERLGARLHYVRYKRRDLRTFAGRFRLILREGRYDAIHDHQAYVSGWHLLVGHGLLPPVRVVHVHNPAYQRFQNYGATISRRLAMRLGDFLVARYATHIAGTSTQCLGENGFGARRFDGIPKRALYCGFDPTRFVGDRQQARRSILSEFAWPDETRLILVAGRIDASPDPQHSQVHKNSAFAVQVAIEAVSRDTRARALFAGARSEALPTLERRIAQAGCTDKIRFAGIRTDIGRLMLASDALLFPSRAEGLGMAVVEAQSAGLPVLASTAVPAECLVVPSLVQFLPVEAGSQCWADRLLELFDSVRDAETANRQVSESAFSIQQSARALATLYQTGVFA